MTKHRLVVTASSNTNERLCPNVFLNSTEELSQICCFVLFLFLNVQKRQYYFNILFTVLFDIQQTNKRYKQLNWLYICLLHCCPLDCISFSFIYSWLLANILIF